MPPRALRSPCRPPASQAEYNSCSGSAARPHSRIPISSSNPYEVIAARSRRDGDMSTPAAPVVVGSLVVAVTAWAAASASMPMAEMPGVQWFIRDCDWRDIRRQRCRRVRQLRRRHRRSRDGRAGMGGAIFGQSGSSLTLPRLAHRQSQHGHSQQRGQGRRQWLGRARAAPSPSSPGAGQTQTVSNIIDQTGLGGGRGNAEAIASPRPAAVR